MKFHSKIYGWEYAWEEFANELGGSAETDPQSTPSLKQIQVPVPGVGPMYFMPEVHKVGSQTDTTVLIAYKPADSFVFALHTQKFLNSVSKLLGAQDIIIGDAAVDQRFIIQSNDEQRVSELLSDPKLKELLLGRPDMHLRVLSDGDQLPHGEKLPVGQNAICYTQHKALDSYDELAAVYKLLASMAEFAMVLEKAEVSKTRIAESLLKR
jgi:hypothetical protein